MTDTLNETIRNPVRDRTDKQDEPVDGAYHLTEEEERIQKLRDIIQDLENKLNEVAWAHQNARLDLKTIMDDMKALDAYELRPEPHLVSERLKTIVDRIKEDLKKWGYLQ